MSSINEAPAVAKEGDIFIPAGNLGIKRKDMPQIDPSAQEQFFKELRSKGVRITKEKIKSADLTPTQAEINGNKVASMVKAAGSNPDFFGKEPIMVSGDNYVLDGHHRWLASLNIDPDYVQTVWKIHMPIKPLLKFAIEDFTDVAFRDIRESFELYRACGLNESVAAETARAALFGTGKIPAYNDECYETTNPYALRAMLDGWTDADHTAAAKHWRTLSESCKVQTLCESGNDIDPHALIRATASSAAFARIAALHEAAVGGVDEAKRHGVGPSDVPAFMLKRVVDPTTVSADDHDAAINYLAGTQSKGQLRKNAGVYYAQAQTLWKTGKKAEAMSNHWFGSMSLKAAGDPFTPASSLFSNIGEGTIDEAKPKMGKGVRPLNVSDNDDADDEYANVRECPSCGEENGPMGALGNRQHYRCRACGMMYSHDPRKDESTGNALLEVMADWLDENKPTTPSEFGKAFLFNTQTATAILAKYDRSTGPGGKGRSWFYAQVGPILAKISKGNMIRAAYTESVVNEGPGVDSHKWFRSQANTLKTIGTKLEQQGVSTEYSDRELYISGDEYDIRVYYVGSSASNGERASTLVMKITDPDGKTQFYGGWLSTKGNKPWEAGLKKFEELTGVAFPSKGSFKSGGGAGSGGRVKSSSDFMGMFEGDITERINTLLNEAMLHGRNVDKVLQSYMTTALWSSTDNRSSNGGDPLDKNFDISDISPKVKAQMRKDVEKFIRDTADIPNDDWDDTQFGHDFWLSRNGHGAGFWDFYDHRNTAEERANGDALHKVAAKFGNFDLYVVKFQNQEVSGVDFDPDDNTVYAYQVAESVAPRARGSLQEAANLTTRSDFATLSQSQGRTTMLAEAVENAELSAAAAELTAHANKLLPFVSGGVKISIGVPVLYLSMSTVTKDKWANGIFENGPTMRIGITHDDERPVGAVSITANEQPTSGTTRNRGATYSADFTVHGRHSANSTVANFKPRAMNKKPLDKIVAYVKKVITQFADTNPSGPKGESRNLLGEVRMSPARFSQSDATKATLKAGINPKPFEPLPADAITSRVKGKRYTYESGAGIYDVIVYDDGSVGYQTNTRWSDPGEYHKGIIKHFKLSISEDADVLRGVDEATPPGVKVIKLKSLNNGATAHQVVVDGRSIGDFYVGRDDKGAFYTTHTDLRGRAVKAGEVLRDRAAMIQAMIAYDKAESAKDFAKKKASPNRVEMRGDKVTAVYYNGQLVTDHGVKIDNKADIRRGAVFDLEDKYDTEFAIVSESVTEAKKSDSMVSRALSLAGKNKDYVAGYVVGFGRHDGEVLLNKQGKWVGGRETPYTWKTRDAAIAAAKKFQTNDRRLYVRPYRYTTPNPENAENLRPWSEAEDMVYIDGGSVDEAVADATTLLSMIKAGTRVTIRVPNGIGRDGLEWTEKTGKAVMPSKHGGWVLNMGGRYGTPGIADERSIVAVGKTRRADESVTEGKGDGKTARLSIVNDQGEWQVKVYIDGKYNEKLSYFGDASKADAAATAADMKSRLRAQGYTIADKAASESVDEADCRSKPNAQGMCVQPDGSMEKAPASVIARFRKKDEDTVEEGRVEYAVWGVAPGDTDEQVLFARVKGEPITSKPLAERLKEIAVNKGATGVRIQTVDMSTPPDFRKGVRETVTEADAPENPFKVGDILYSSWGYDQTNIDFYRVEKVSGGTVTVIQLESEEKTDPSPGGAGWSMIGKVTPTNRTKGAAFRRKVQTTGREPGIKIESYAGAWKWDGKPKQVSHYA